MAASIHPFRRSHCPAAAGVTINGLKFPPEATAAAATTSTAAAKLLMRVEYVVITDVTSKSLWGAD